MELELEVITDPSSPALLPGVPGRRERFFGDDIQGLAEYRRAPWQQYVDPPGRKQNAVGVPKSHAVARDVPSRSESTQGLAEYRGTPG